MERECGVDCVSFDCLFTSSICFNSQTPIPASLFTYDTNTHLFIDAMESYVCENYKSSNLSLGF